MNKLEALCRENHLNVSRETIGHLEKYARLLCHWNKSRNLIAPGTVKQVYERHILDGLQLIRGLTPSQYIFDLGSGNGVPGLVLAIAGYPKVVLFEKNKHKVSFLWHVKAALSLEISIVDQDYRKSTLPKADILTARGVASLQSLLETTEGLRKEDTQLFLHKGQRWQQEIKAARENFAFDYEALPSIVEAHSVILRVKNVTPK